MLHDSSQWHLILWLYSLPVVFQPRSDMILCRCLLCVVWCSVCFQCGYGSGRGMCSGCSGVLTMVLLCVVLGVWDVVLCGGGGCLRCCVWLCIIQYCKMLWCALVLVFLCSGAIMLYWWHSCWSRATPQLHVCMSGIGTEVSACTFHCGGLPFCGCVLPKLHARM